MYVNETMHTPMQIDNKIKTFIHFPTNSTLSIAWVYKIKQNMK